MSEQIGDGGPEFLARDGWQHADKWKRDGKHFCVQVSRHSTPEYSADFPRVVTGVEHHWCVYLYIYPKHPSFAHFNPDGDMRSQPNYDCHSYVSLFKVNRDNKGAISSYQLGWDYSHDGDSYYLECATPDDASSVFFDASRLFDDAEERAAAIGETL